MKNYFFSKVDHFRYERKFCIDSLTREEVELMVKLHPAMFREIYPPRAVNNIYLDSVDLHNYFDNINGLDQRLKIRIRWYGELFGFIEKPILEVKLKHNLHIGKLFYLLKPFILDNGFSIDLVRKVVKESSLPGSLILHLVRTRPVLLNSYNRKYFLSADRKYRITIDWKMQVYKLSFHENNFLCQMVDYKTIILELKYNKLQDQLVDKITNYFPIRLSKNSKYVEGVEKFNIG